VALGDYASRNIVPELQRIVGVGQAQLFGTENAMRIWIDPAKLQGFNLSATDVNNAIRAQNAQVSSGTIGDLPNIPGQAIAATVVVNGQLANVDQFKNIVLRANTDGSTVRLKDVARVELGGQSYATSARLNGVRRSASACSRRPTATRCNRPRRSAPRWTSCPLLPAGREVGHSVRQLALRAASRSPKWSRRCWKPWRWCSW
jgi:multidrug efflux pump subunit AcrB